MTELEVLKPFMGSDGKMHEVGERMQENDSLSQDIIAKGFAKKVEALNESPALGPRKPSEPGTGGEIKDISEVVPKAVDVEGPQRNVEELVGRVIVIERFGLRPSEYGKDKDGKPTKEYATVQIINDNGEKAWFNTGSGPILEALNQIGDKLPVRCKIESRKSEKGQRYFTLTSAKETK